jgi:hypothetical protein
MANTVFVLGAGRMELVATRDVAESNLVDSVILGDIETSEAERLCKELFEHDYPSLFAQTFPGLRHVVAAINWDSRPHQHRVRFDTIGISGPFHAFDFWHRQYLGLLDDELPITSIPPHGCALFSLVPDAHSPLLVSSMLHMAQGGLEVTH